MVHLQEKQKLAREEKGRMIKKQTQSLLEIKKNTVRGRKTMRQTKCLSCSLLVILSVLPSSDLQGRLVLQTKLICYNF